MILAEMKDFEIFLNEDNRVIYPALCPLQGCSLGVLEGK